MSPNSRWFQKYKPSKLKEQNVNLSMEGSPYIAHCLIFENEATSTDNQNSKFECIHHFPQIFSLFQIAHLVECEGLV